MYLESEPKSSSASGREEVERIAREEGRRGGDYNGVGVDVERLRFERREVR